MAMTNRGRKVLDAKIHNCNRAFLGTEYGGWTICPDQITEESVIYAFGVGEDASFDVEIINLYGCEVHSFDPTPKSIEWVKHQTWPENLHFHDYGIGSRDRLTAFYPPENPEHVSHSILKRSHTKDKVIKVQLFRLKTIAQLLGHTEIAILKMDIEGAEYEVISDILNTPKVNIQQILVEFHDFFPSISERKTKSAIRKLETAGYRLFNISNRGYEYSFTKVIDG